MADAKQENKPLKTPKPEPSSQPPPPLSKALTLKNPPVNSEDFIRRVKQTGACRRCGNVFHKAKDCSAPFEYVSSDPGQMPPGKKHHCFSLFVDCDVNEDGARAWQISTTSSCHICQHREYFSTYEPVEEYIEFGAGSEGRIIGVGTVVLKLVSGNTLILPGVKHVPKMVKNIISPFLISSKMQCSGEGGQLIYEDMVVAEASPTFELLVAQVVTN